MGQGCSISILLLQKAHLSEVSCLVSGSAPNILILVVAQASPVVAGRPSAAWHVAVASHNTVIKTISLCTLNKCELVRWKCNMSDVTLHSCSWKLGHVDPSCCFMQMASPMAGSFYRSPAPGEAAFCKEGDKVSKGQTVCIIEAMKLMNEIEVTYSGIEVFCWRLLLGFNRFTLLLLHFG